MPTALVVVSERVSELSEEHTRKIREVIADALDSRARRLDLDHVVLRVVPGERRDMLADIEIEVHAQRFRARVRDRDERSRQIAEAVSTMLQVECSAWINLATVGYARVTPQGKTYYSD